MEAYKFRVQFLEGAKLFLDSLDEKAREKVLYNIWKSRFANDKELLKKLSEDIWEFRTLHNKNYYRLCAFWDKTDHTDTIVIATHGLLKKTGKIVGSDIDRARVLRKAYFDSKK